MLVADKQQTLEEYLISVEERIDEVVAEVLELRAKWESVPWEALKVMQQSAAGSYPSSDTPFMRVVSWYIVNHPKEDADNE